MEESGIDDDEVEPLLVWLIVSAWGLDELFESESVAFDKREDWVVAAEVLAAVDWALSLHETWDSAVGCS